VVRVAVTRPREKAAETEKLIRKQGWEPVIVSSIELVPIPIDPAVVLTDFDCLVVTSATGADLLWQHFKEELKNIDIAVVGPLTAEAFENNSVSPTFVSEEYVGEKFARELTDIVRGKRVLVARAKKGKRRLVEILSDAAIVSEIAIYDSIPPRDETGMKRFKTLLEKREIDAIIFTSSLSAQNLLEFIGGRGQMLLKKIVVCAIGPITAKTLSELGIPVDCMPTKYTVDAALDEIKQVLPQKI